MLSDATLQYNLVRFRDNFLVSRQAKGTRLYSGNVFPWPRNPYVYVSQSVSVTFWYITDVVVLGMQEVEIVSGGSLEWVVVVVGPPPPPPPPWSAGAAGTAGTAGAGLIAGAEVGLSTNAIETLVLLDDPELLAVSFWACATASMAANGHNFLRQNMLSSLFRLATFKRLSKTANALRASVKVSR